MYEVLTDAELARMRAALRAEQIAAGIDPDADVYGPVAVWGKGIDAYAVCNGRTYIGWQGGPDTPKARAEFERVFNDAVELLAERAADREVAEFDALLAVA